MRLACGIVIACVAVGAVVPAGGSVRAEEFRSEAGRFRFQAPPDWVRFDAFKHGEAAKRDAGGNRDVIFHDGFEPRGARPGFDGVKLPFLLIHEDKKAVGRLNTYDMVERSANNEWRRELKDAHGDINFGALTLDRAKNRFAASFDATVANRVRTKGMVYIFLGSKSTVTIMCFTRDFDLPAQQASFDTMADSFRFDPGFQFAPLDPSTILLVVAGIAVSGCCCVFAVVAIVVGAIILILRR